MDIRLPKLVPAGPIRRKDRDAYLSKPKDGASSKPKDEGPSKQKGTGRVDLLIAYGTTTGTAQDVAYRIAREAYSYKMMSRDVHYFKPRVVSIQDISVEYLKTHWIDNNAKTIFVISTTGQGEFPDDSKDFWSELNLLSVSTDAQIPIQYVVVGLGDSSYEMFNYPAKKLQSLIGQLGGIGKFEACLCDDQHDLGFIGALNPFLGRLWAEWVPKSCQSNPNAAPLARYTLLSSMAENAIPSQPDEICEKLEIRKVIRNERITAEDHFQDTRLIAFETEASNLRFREGDVVQVFPENFPDNVKGFFDLYPNLKDQPPFFLIADADMQWVTIPPEFYRLCGPQPWTWEEVASRLLNFQGIPGVYAFEILRFFAKDPLIKEKFDEYCGPQGLEELYNYTNRPRRTILEVLLDFPSTAALVPPNYLFELIPFMRPRAFSIASPPKEDHHIEILVAVVQYKTNLKTDRKGTCSYWLAHDCPIGKEVGIFIDKGSMRPPAENAHVVMIGPGTGVAPFRSMIKQHAEEWDKHLFFGCRNKNKDFYFGDEFATMVSRNQLAFYPAFSRDRIGRKVNYVQDLIAKEDELFQRLVMDNLPMYIYVCGRAGDMPKDVRSAVKNVLANCGIMDTEAFLQYMIENGYYQTETY